MPEDNLDASSAAATTTVAAPAPSTIDRFIAPELSWLKLNRRYLTEARNQDRPLLERVKLLASFGSHLDEFLMEFLPQLHLREEGVSAQTPSGPVSDLHKTIQSDHDLAEAAWAALRAELDRAGIHLAAYAALTDEQKAALAPHFKNEIFPLCTPLAHDPAHPFPFIADHTRNFLIVLAGAAGERYGFLNVAPQLQRLIEVPAAGATGGAAKAKEQTFIWLDEILRAHLDAFFPGEQIQEVYYFRVLRQTLITTEEAKEGDLLDAVRRDLQADRFAPIVALQVPSSMPQRRRRFLMENLQAGEEATFVTNSLAGVRAIGDIAHVKRPELKYPELAPRTPKQVIGGKNFFKSIRKGPVLLVRPYDSFDTVVRFVQEAATDPDVIAIRQTLYHVGVKSPIATALIHAAQAGKQVTVVMEIRAHFDEENNIEWALAMKKAGVDVVYGAQDTKTHAKSIVVVRREAKGVQRYAHISTGNYDVSAAEHECDLGMLTSDPEVTWDVLELFNHLTSRSRTPEFKRLLVAPINLRAELARRIEREIGLAKDGKPARLIFQMDGLTDNELIDALYRASTAGVQVDLIVRSVCCLRPGLPGVSDRIRVVNFLGRFKEHSRVYYFLNGGDEELFFGSADLMTAKVDNRVEMLVPVEDPGYRRYIVETLLEGYLRDNTFAADLDCNGDCLSRAEVAPPGRFDLEAELIDEAKRNLDHRLPRRRKQK
jgi:polyphosphate kinase